MAEQSKIHRREVGDKVSYLDPEGNYLEGEITGFANDELTHITCVFDDKTITLTEDDVMRIA